MKTILTALVLTVMTTMVTSSSAEAAQCKVELENGRGRILEVFNGYGYNRQDACQEAKRDCRRTIRSGYYRARILNCNVVQPRRRMVQKSCSASLIGPRGRTIEHFLGQASGPQGSGVQAQACERAARQCNTYKQRTGRYRAQCEVQGSRGNGRIGSGNGNGGRHIPTPPPRRRRLVVLDA
ncbi:MAG: hypothetical protein ACJAS4_003243 [Bacteriovoracaceae bacterium]|jgi:hypothetical protein